MTKTNKKIRTGATIAPPNGFCELVAELMANNSNGKFFLALPISTIYIYIYIKYGGGISGEVVQAAG